jgi:hypothetical protein
MEDREKFYIKLRFGLSLKRILDRNKLISVENERNGVIDRDLIKSFGKLEVSSGIPKATLIRIVSGKINTASTTLAAIIDALEMSLSEFGTFYDVISEKDIEEYKKTIAESHKERSLKKSRKQKPKKNKKSK